MKKKHKHNTPKSIMHEIMSYSGYTGRQIALYTGLPQQLIMRIEKGNIKELNQQNWNKLLNLYFRIYVSRLTLKNENELIDIEQHKTYWRQIIQKILLENTHKSNNPITSNHRYYFKEPYDEIYFTRRDIEIAIKLKNNTYKQIAQYYNLSPKTVEFYATNLRNKFRCKSKAKLVSILEIFGFFDHITE